MLPAFLQPLLFVSWILCGSGMGCSCLESKIWSWLNTGREASGRPASDCELLPGGVPAEMKAGAEDTGYRNPLPTRPPGPHHHVTRDESLPLWPWVPIWMALPRALMQVCQPPSQESLCRRAAGVDPGQREKCFVHRSPRTTGEQAPPATEQGPDC